MFFSKSLVTYSILFFLLNFFVYLIFSKKIYFQVDLYLLLFCQIFSSFYLINFILKFYLFGDIHQINFYFYIIVILQSMLGNCNVCSKCEFSSIKCFPLIKFTCFFKFFCNVLLHYRHNIEKLWLVAYKYYYLHTHMFVCMHTYTQIYICK